VLFRSAMTEVNGQRFRTGSWAITLQYIGGGATVDYVAADLGIPALTLELRPGDGTGGGFAPSTAEIAPSVSENIEGALYFLNWANEQFVNSKAPTISDFQITALSSTTATFSWTTDIPATRSLIVTETEFNVPAIQPDKLRSFDHTLTANDLAPNTIYQYEICSEAIGGEETCKQGEFTTFATPQDITPPGYPAILSLRHSSPGQFTWNYITLNQSDVVSSRLYESSDFENWNMVAETTTLSSGGDFISVDAPPPGSFRAYYMVNVDDAGLESIPSDVYGYAAPISDHDPDILIVDGFDEWNGRPIAQDLNHPFAAWHGLDLAAAGFSFEACANQQVGTEFTLTDYDVVIWVLGDETNSLTTLDRTELRAFLENGGNLFLSGSNTANDLHSTDRSFLNDYLGVDFNAGDVDFYDVTSSGANSFYQGEPFTFDYGDLNIYRVGSPDRILPIGSSEEALEVNFGRVVSLQKKDTFGSGTEEGAVIFLSIPYETISPVTARRQIMKDAMEFFDLEGQVVNQLWYLY